MCLVGQDDLVVVVEAGSALSALSIEAKSISDGVHVKSELEPVAENGQRGPFEPLVGGDDAVCAVGVRDAADSLEARVAEVLVEAELQSRVGLAVR